MQLTRIIPILAAGGILIADLAEPGYGRFSWQNIYKPAQQTATRALARSLSSIQPVSQVIGISFNGRDKGCKGEANKQHQGFNAAQWQRFKKAGKGQKAEGAIALLGGAFCQQNDGSFRFLPNFATDKKLDLRIDAGRVQDAKLNRI